MPTNEASVTKSVPEVKPCQVRLMTWLDAGSHAMLAHLVQQSEVCSQDCRRPNVSVVMLALNVCKVVQSVQWHDMRDEICYLNIILDQVFSIFKIISESSNLNLKIYNFITFELSEIRNHTDTEFLNSHINLSQNLINKSRKTNIMLKD
jgi:hypothetical protein